MASSTDKALTRVAAVAIFVALLFTLLVSIAPNVNTRIVQSGELVWPGYASELRSDPEAPDCSLEEIDAQLKECPPAGTPPAAAPTGGDDDDPFADKLEDDPFADAADDEDPFADKAEDDPFGGGGDPFGAAPDEPQVNCQALRALRDRCEIRQAAYAGMVERITAPVKVFRAFEGTISEVAKFPWWRQLLVLVVLLGAFATTLHRMHIALRDPRNVTEHRLRQGIELVGHLLLLGSAAADWRVLSASSAEVENADLPVLWAVGLLVLAALNVRHLLRPPDGLDGPPTTAVRLLMVIPLWAYMVIIAGVWFQLVEFHPSGQAIYLHKFVQHPSVYLGIGLYIWAGMLLARTRIAPLSVNVLLPWKLPPTLLAWLVVVLAAFPTAYSGASGIFVLAAGAVVFDRLTKAGASRRIALAATAMSGSLGVVLRPCLVVVLIAVLNKQVTTDELFGNGLWVFALTVVLFGIAMVLRNRDPFKLAPAAEALPATWAAVKRVAPYAGLAVGVVAAFALFIATWLNEHTAPFVVPVVMLVLVVYDKVRGPMDDDEPPPGETEVHWEPLWPSLIKATEESSHHVGALLMLMACSVGIGGVVERSEVMGGVVPSEFGSVWTAMAFLVVVMVLVGMTMDALGAVILVSFTIAGIAYSNGIDPVHFWMMVLVAFELGYLTPPVAINHLLARQVVGPAARVEDDPVEGFLARYEHILIPMAVMGTALVIVAFVPLLFYA